MDGGTPPPAYAYDTLVNTCISVFTNSFLGLVQACARLKSQKVANSKSQVQILTSDILQPNFNWNEALPWTPEDLNMTQMLPAMIPGGHYLLGHCYCR
jgi:hypothetical protein